MYIQFWKTQKSFPKSQSFGKQKKLNYFWNIAKNQIVSKC